MAPVETVNDLVQRARAGDLDACGRLAMLRYGIDDIRKIDGARVA